MSSAKSTSSAPTFLDPLSSVSNARAGMPRRIRACAPAPETPAPTTGIEETAASGATATTTTVKTPSVDSATFTPEALARFEAWKVRHGATAPITTPEPMTAAILAADPVDPIFLPSTDTTNGEPA